MSDPDDRRGYERLVSGNGFKGVGRPWLLRQVAFNAIGRLYFRHEDEVEQGRTGVARLIELRKDAVLIWANERWGEGWEQG